MLLALLPGGAKQQGEQSGEGKGDDETGADEDEGNGRRASVVWSERINGEAGGKETDAGQHTELDADGPAPLRRAHLFINIGRNR